MTAPEFLDSNVLVYAYDVRDKRKQRTARELLLRAIAGEILISTQVLAEFCTTMLHKISPAATAEDVAAGLDAFEAIRVIQPDAGMVRRALEAREKYGVHFYDGMIIAAAERGRCERIWSEDFNEGQAYFGVTVSNPFR
jgi:predicted nucleic acid-binding protein